MTPRACSDSKQLPAALPLLAAAAGLALLGQAGAIDLNVDSFVPNADQWLTTTFEMIKDRGLFTALAYLSQIILFVLWFNKVLEAWPSKNLAAIGKTTFLAIIVAAVIQSAVTSGSMTNTVYRIPITAWTSVYKASTDGLASSIKDGLTKDTIALAQSMQDFTTNSFMGLGTMSNIDAGSLYQTGVANPGTTLESGSTAVKQVWDEQQKFYEKQRDKLDTMAWAFQIGYLILMGFFLAFAGVIYLSGASVILALFMLLPALAFWAGGRGRGLNIVLGTMMTGIATVAILPTMLLVVSGLALQQPTITLKDAVDKQNLKAQAAVTLYANNMIQCAADAAASAGKGPAIPGTKPIIKVITREMCVVNKNAPVVFSEIGRVLMRVIMGLAVMVISMIVGISIGAAVIRLVPNYIQAVFEGGPTGSDNTSVGSIGRTAIQAGAAARAITSGVAAPLANGAMRAVGGADSAASKGNAGLGQKMSDNRAAKAMTSGGASSGAGGGAGASGAGAGVAGAATAAGAGAAAAGAKMGGNAAGGIGGQSYGAAGGPSAGAAAARGGAAGASSVAGGSASGGSASAGPSAVATGGPSGGTTGGAASSSSSTAGMAPGGTVPSAAPAGGSSSSATVPNAPTTLADTGAVQSTQNPAPQAISAGPASNAVSSGGAPTPISSTSGRAPAAVAQATGSAASSNVSSSGGSQRSAAASGPAAGPAAVPAGAAAGASSVGAAGPASATNSGQAGPGVVPGETSSKAINADGAAALPGSKAEKQSAKQQHAAAVKEIQQARQARQDAKSPPTATALVQRDAVNAGKAAAAAGAAAGGQLANNASRNIKAARATAKHNEANPDSKKTVQEMRQQMERNGDFDRGRDNAAVRNVTAAHNAGEDRRAAGDASYVKQPITADQARDTLSRSGNLPHQQAGNTYRAEETRREHRQNEAGRQAADPNHKPTSLSAEQAGAINEQRGNTVQAEEHRPRA